jgi:hypothetical protein
MFWESLITGLKVLTFWETYVAGLVYLIIFFSPMAIIVMLSKNNGALVGQMPGCLSIFLIAVLQVAAIAVMILMLAPIIFGFGEDAAWNFPWRLLNKAPEAFFKLIAVMVVVAIILAFIPVLGQLQSIHTLVLGGIALVFVLEVLDATNIGMIKAQVDFVPGFWFSVGLIVIGGITSYIGILVAALAVSALDLVKESIGKIVMFPIAAIFGFIPVFMYGAWLGAQFRGGF